MLPLEGLSNKKGFGQRNSSTAMMTPDQQEQVSPKPNGKTHNTQPRNNFGSGEVDIVQNESGDENDNFYTLGTEQDETVS